MITAGIDVGSISTKCAILKDGEILLAKVILTGYNSQAAGQRIFEAALAELGLSSKDIDRIIATGYGRNKVDFAHQAITEITCHGAGTNLLCPGARTVIDIGGQDSKAISLNGKGKVLDFVMNDKCAAGTGRFLEVMARALEVDLDQFGPISVKARTPAKISSLCTVFAESEVISLIAKGEKRENIIAGIHTSIATRVLTMAKRIRIFPPVMMSGGVAKNIGVIKALEARLGHELMVPELAQANGAIGAALLAQG